MDRLEADQTPHHSLMLYWRDRRGQTRTLGRTSRSFPPRENQEHHAIYYLQAPMRALVLIKANPISQDQRPFFPIGLSKLQPICHLRIVPRLSMLQHTFDARRDTHSLTRIIALAHRHIPALQALCSCCENRRRARLRLKNVDKILMIRRQPEPLSTTSTPEMLKRAHDW